MQNRWQAAQMPRQDDEPEQAIYRQGRDGSSRNVAGGLELRCKIICDAREPQSWGRVNVVGWMASL
jgi:hypothetical protein